MDSADEWDDWGDEPGDTDPPEDRSSGPDNATSSSHEDRINSILESLRDFQKDLADNEVFENVNKHLAKSKYDQVMAYYNANSKLSQYTIDTELKVYFKSIL